MYDSAVSETGSEDSEALDEVCADDVCVCELVLLTMLSAELDDTEFVERGLDATKLDDADSETEAFTGTVEPPHAVSNETASSTATAIDFFISHPPKNGIKHLSLKALYYLLFTI